MSSEITKRYFQKCEICKEEFERICEADILETLRLPFRYVSQVDGEKITRVYTLSVCRDCIEKVKKCLLKEFELSDVGLSGVVAKWKGKEA